jgi:hypothetical protein
MEYDSSRIATVLDAECTKAHAISLTQATQFNATQRAIERGRTRDVILQIPVVAMLEHIQTGFIDDTAIRRFCLILYSLNHVVPTDTQASLAQCKARLDKYVLAILRRVENSDVPGKWASTLCQIAVSCLDGLRRYGIGQPSF